MEPINDSAGGGSGDSSVEPVEMSPTEHSSSLARLIEYQLLADLLQEAWFGRNMLIDVMHSSVDAFGYDLVLESGRVIRHVQLKARKLDGKRSAYDINTTLRDRPSGCVIWVGYRRRTGTNSLDLEYRFFGGPPGQRLADLGEAPVLHTKANSTGQKAIRPGLRSVKLSAFEKVTDIPDLLDKLFGPAGGH